MVMEKTGQERPVVVIDDDPDVTFLMQHILRRGGIDNPLVALPDAEQAMRVLEKIGAKVAAGEAQLPLFIVIDLRMPRVSGFELLKWLRNRPEFSGVPRVVMSSSVDERDVARAHELGADGFLTKYPTPATFLAIARYAGDMQAGDKHAAVETGS